MDEIIRQTKLKYENSSQRQRSWTKYVTNFQSLLAFTVGHIPIKLHQFLISSYRYFVRTDIDAQTDAQTPPRTIPARSRRTGKNTVEYRVAEYAEMQEQSGICRISRAAGNSRVPRVLGRPMS